MTYITNTQETILDGTVEALWNTKNAGLVMAVCTWSTGRAYAAFKNNGNENVLGTVAQLLNTTKSTWDGDAGLKADAKAIIIDLDEAVANNKTHMEDAMFYMALVQRLVAPFADQNSNHMLVTNCAMIKDAIIEVYGALIDETGVDETEVEAAPAPVAAPTSNGFKLNGLTKVAIGAFAGFMGMGAIGAMLPDAELPTWNSGSVTPLMCSFDHATNDAKDAPAMKTTQSEYVNGFRLLWADGVNDVFEGTGNGTEMKTAQGTWSFDGSAHDFTLTSAANGSVVTCN